MVHDSRIPPSPEAPQEKEPCKYIKDAKHRGYKSAVTAREETKKGHRIYLYASRRGNVEKKKKGGTRASWFGMRRREGEGEKIREENEEKFRKKKKRKKKDVVEQGVMRRFEIRVDLRKGLVSALVPFEKEKKKTRYRSYLITSCAFFFRFCCFMLFLSSLFQSKR